jgi:hypothetical protein
LLPSTLSEAEAIPPDTVRAALPSETLPNVKLTVPVGGALPDAGRTSAVIVVDALCAMLGGFAAAVIVVLTFGTVTLTTTEAADPLNFGSPG